MRDEHVVDDRAILVPVRSSIPFDHGIDALVEPGAVHETELAHEEVLLDPVKFGGIGGRYRRRVVLVDARPAADRDLLKQCHICSDAAFRLKVGGVFLDQFVAFAHGLASCGSNLHVVVYRCPTCTLFFQGVQYDA